MYKLAKPFFLKVRTPLHAGIGMGLGVVDLPIQRERHTDFPKIEGSGLKGSIREVFESFKTEDNKVNKKELNDLFQNLAGEWTVEKEGKKEVKTNKKGNKLTIFDQAIDLTFGPDNEAESHAGALGFTDARLLLFPVKSMKGVFAFITCPTLLTRFKNDLQLCQHSGIELKEFNKIESLPENKYLEPDADSTVPSKCFLPSESKVILEKDKEVFVILEEFSFRKSTKFNADLLAEFLQNVLDIGKLSEKIVILHDDDFRDFVALSTEVITRNKINNETGTVAEGQLFTEEYLPCESVLYSLALTSPIFQENDSDKGIFSPSYAGKPDEIKNMNEEHLVMQFFIHGLPEVIQIGGNATIGKGLVQTVK